MVIGILLVLLGLAFATTPVQYWFRVPLGQLPRQPDAVAELIQSGPTWAGLVLSHAIPLLALLGGVLVMAGKRWGSWLALVAFVGLTALFVVEGLEVGFGGVTVELPLSVAGVVLAALPWARR